MIEYKYITISYRDFEELNKQLNDWGKEEWEIIYLEKEDFGGIRSKYLVDILLKRIKT